MDNPIIERSQNLDKPNLFLFTETKLLNPLNEKVAQSVDDNFVPVYLKIVEINLLKISLKKNNSKDQSIPSILLIFIIKRQRTERI